MSDHLKYLRELTEKLIKCEGCPTDVKISWMSKEVKKVLKKIDNTHTKKIIKDIAAVIIEKETSDIKDSS
ncbi:hypothetical protein CMI47_11435 [Candidatus Pacearchaeota archaeon]|nr:hypothetical protein [Candidatus Pacearchaeota archaeon]|tara:strand:+ start:616 stop:825 length:210 start_codon:yes stop_codon:yes gene_type:complete